MHSCAHLAIRGNYNGFLVQLLDSGAQRIRWRDFKLSRLGIGQSKKRTKMPRNRTISAPKRHGIGNADQAWRKLCPILYMAEEIISAGPVVASEAEEIALAFPGDENGWPSPWESLDHFLREFGLPRKRYCDWRLTVYRLGTIHALESAFFGRLAATNGIECIIVDRSNGAWHLGHLASFVHERGEPATLRNSAGNRDRKPQQFREYE